MKEYSIILADPPWAYKVWAKKGMGRTAENHYPTMHIKDIQTLPVGRLAAKDCALFLWVTMPTLPEAFSVIKAWGFTYKTVAFVWVKQNRKSPSLFWGAGTLDTRQCGIVPAGNKGKPETPVCRRPSGDCIAGGAAQQKAGYDSGADCFPDGRSAPCGTVCPPESPRLGRMGKRGGTQPRTGGGINP